MEDAAAPRTVAPGETRTISEAHGVPKASTESDGIPGGRRFIESEADAAESVGSARSALHDDGITDGPVVNDRVAGTRTGAEGIAVTETAANGMTIAGSRALRSARAGTVTDRIADSRARTNGRGGTVAGNEKGPWTIVIQNERVQNRVISHPAARTSDGMETGLRHMNPKDRNFRSPRLVRALVRGRRKDRRNIGLGKRRTSTLKAPDHLAVRVDRLRTTNGILDAESTGRGVRGAHGRTGSAAYPASVTRTEGPKGAPRTVPGPAGKSQIEVKTTGIAGAEAEADGVTRQASMLRVARAVPRAPSHATASAVKKGVTRTNAATNNAQATALGIPRTGTGAESQTAAGTSVTGAEAGTRGGTMMTDSAAGTGPGTNSGASPKGAVGSKAVPPSATASITRARPRATRLAVPAAGTVCAPGTGSITQRVAAARTRPQAVPIPISGTKNVGKARTGDHKIEREGRAGNESTSGDEPPDLRRQRKNGTVKVHTEPAHAAGGGRVRHQNEV